MQYELRDDFLQIRHGSVGQSLSGRVSLPVLVTTSAYLIDASFLIAVEALLVGPQHNGSPHVHLLTGNDDRGAAPCRDGDRGLRSKNECKGEHPKHGVHAEAHHTLAACLACV